LTQDLGETEAADGYDGEESEPPWVPVTPGEVAGLMASYREARVWAERIRRGLAVRMRPEQMPTVAGTVGVDGEPMVCIDAPRPPGRDGEDGSGAVA
jgi:hypothetical protein